MNKLKVFTAFSGYDSQCMALDRLGIDYSLVGYSEIDKYAIQAHNAVYPQYADRNYGDISKIDWNKVPDFDLFTYSFPCTDISSAGQQKGLTEGSGTRSSLLWECRKTIEIKHPKYLLMENVKALTSDKFMPYLRKWLSFLESMGYSNFTKVLNSKDYGVPQNRERVFVVSILGDERYYFPKPFKLEKRLKDVLESNVDESYYISEKTVNRMIRNNHTNDFCIDVNSVAKTICSSCYKMTTFDNYVSCAMRGRNPENPSDRNPGIPTEQRIEMGGDVANCLTTVQKDSLIAEPSLRIKQATKLGYIDIKPGSIFDASYPDSNTRRGRVQGDGKISPTLTAQGEPPCYYEGVTNKITTVQKDNLLVEPKFVGYTRDDKGKVSKRHLQDVCNTIHGSTGSGGNTDCFVAEPKIVEPQIVAIINGENKNNEKRTIFETDYKRNTAEILSILRREIGKEENKRKIRRFICFLKEKVLQQRMYEESFCSRHVEEPRLFSCSSHSEEDSLSHRAEGESLRDMWFKKECRYTSQRWELSKQLVMEFNECMSFVPFKIAQKAKRYVCYMWKENKGTWVLQQALYSLEKIWESSNNPWPDYRIRKLTERECFRLMGVSEQNIDKMMSAGISKTQLYKMAGNSIVVDVLYYIFKKMFIDKKANKGEQQILFG